MNHAPMCPVCKEFEVGTFTGSDEFCSATCESFALDWEGGAHHLDEYDEERKLEGDMEGLD